jgi:hypothetical protein
MTKGVVGMSKTKSTGGNQSSTASSNTKGPEEKGVAPLLQTHSGGPGLA